ncbi:sigma-70 family RNA polymerase sigma factor [Reichenbachiella sp. MALMAid0571]|uniref:RNA polymerase sigma factor n=1 Tax=Reichenbachiella sp. MALMAid0571 TaxID=3143939 RepID=UPI0032E0037C
MLVSTKTSDYDLLEMISDKDEPFAREAFVMFYNRYSSFLYNTCVGFCKSHDDPESDAKDLVQEVIIKLLNGSWKFKRLKDIKPDEVVIHVRKWLYRIVKNTFNDLYLKKPASKQELIRINEENQDILAWEIHQNSNRNNDQISELNKQRYAFIMNAIIGLKMNEKQREVLKAYVDSGWHDENINWNLPDFRMEELTSKYSLKRNSIIKIKDRLVEKIKNGTKNDPTNN